jgi:hypothetical protein
MVWALRALVSGSAIGCDSGCQGPRFVSCADQYTGSGTEERSKTTTQSLKPLGSTCGRYRDSRSLQLTTKLRSIKLSTRFRAQPSVSWTVSSSDSDAQTSISSRASAGVHTFAEASHYPRTPDREIVSSHRSPPARQWEHEQERGGSRCHTILASDRAHRTSRTRRKRSPAGEVEALSVSTSKWTIASISTSARRTRFRRHKTRQPQPDQRSRRVFKSANRGARMSP